MYIHISYNTHYMQRMSIFLWRAWYASAIPKLQKRKRSGYYIDREWVSFKLGIPRLLPLVGKEHIFSTRLSDCFVPKADICYCLLGQIGHSQIYLLKNFFRAKTRERKEEGSIYYPLGLIVITAQGACLPTNSATLPMVNRFHPLWPCVPRTIRSALSSSAT
jgi:hypothetical protein